MSKSAHKRYAERVSITLGGVFLGLYIHAWAPSISHWLYLIAAAVLIFAPLCSGIVGLLRRLVTGAQPERVSAWVFLVLFFVGVPVALWMLESTRPPVIWVHPTMTLDEQRRTRATCENQALEAVPIGEGAATRIMQRNRYRNNCLVSEGFLRLQLPSD